VTTGVEIYGSGNDRSIIFLHGAGASRLMWIPQLRQLSDEFRTISIDLPGHGVLRAERFTIESASAVAAVALEAHAGGEAVVVGLSGGGYVALALADRNPDGVKGLVLSGASASYRGWAGFSRKMYGYVFGALANRMNGRAEASMRKLLPENLADDILAEPLSMRGAVDSLRDIPGRDYYGMAARFPGPILLLNGERDDVNRKQEAALALVGGAQVEMVSDAGHACSLTQSGAFNESVRAFAREAFAGAARSS
jgi:pimeloyl-ACP methyl ester carboxylesterase